MPKNIDSYLPASEAVARLEQLARHMHARSRGGDLVRWTIKLSFWNPAWIDPALPKPEMILTQASFNSGKPDGSDDDGQG